MMAIRPEPGHSEEEQEESRSTDRRVMTYLSGNTSESFAIEVRSSGSFSDSGGWQPSSQASESEPKDGEQTSLEEQDKQSELSNFKNNERKLCKKWINHLKSKETTSGGYQPSSKYQAGITQISNEELRAQQSFCTTKVNLIHHRMNSKERKSRRRKKMQPELGAETSEIDALNSSVPDELLSRIYFENMRATLKQMAAAKQHISSQCSDCNRKRAELAQSAFLKQKKTLLESGLLQEKIDEYLHTTDFLTHIREAHLGLPRLSDDPRIIWERLKKKTHV
ncbi:uncharacterized protein C8orf48 homolog [Ctenodactylus gundi]